MPSGKWHTDATEFKWYEGFEVHKVYLGAILDLYARRIVSFEPAEAVLAASA
jgi:transposase InsO family protein